MSEQPGDILDEAGRVFDALLRRAARTGVFGTPHRSDDRNRPEPDERPDGTEGTDGDVWASATAEPRRPEGGARDAGGARAERSRDEGGARAGGGERERRGAGGPRVATGAPECRDCPVCRAIAIRREAGGDVARHLREAGESLLAAALDVLAAADRTRDGRARDARTRDGHGRDTGTYRNRPRQESPGRPAGTSERSGTRRGRPDGDAWSAATGGSGD
ncbi:hypothetical protein [Actinomadura algeriensis]|uniref:Uncharacterized protein n=1 Tax=Actinomadura algeriensis TaxID=1679523 RepID=A0ABR9JX57_9ACTN|nr:hypothetical protein [Actinomadura algeriensis]MBE1535160.1 hypothetical protein [Actinomadura algeriensis]